VAETKIRTVRVGDPWDDAQSLARLRYETLTDVIRRAVDAYNADPDAFDAACAKIAGK
jgi:hypothetical protein